MKDLSPLQLFNRAEKHADSDPGAALRDIEALLEHEQDWLKASRFECAAYGLRGWCHFQAGDHAKAGADLDRAVALRGVALENNLNKRACFRLAQGDLRGARADNLRTIARETWADTRIEQSAYRTTQAEIEAAAGNHEAAIWALERAQLIAPRWATWAKRAPTLAETRKDPRFQRLLSKNLVLWPWHILCRGLEQAGVSVPREAPAPVRVGDWDVPGPMRFLFLMEGIGSMTLAAGPKGKPEAARWTECLRKRELASASELSALPGKGKRPWLVWGQRERAEGGERLLIALDDKSPHDPMAFFVRLGQVIGRQRFGAFLERIS